MPRTPAPHRPPRSIPPLRSVRSRASTLFVPLLSLLAATASAENWRAIDPKDRAATMGWVDPRSDAEIVNWEVRFEDSGDRVSIHSDVSQYIQLKVFTGRGRTDYAQITIPSSADYKLMSFAARAVHPNGSIVTIDRSKIFERTVAKRHGKKTREWSFAVPNLEIGSIVEYRWTERHYEHLAHYVSLQLQQLLPVRTTELWIKPYPYEDPRIQMHVRYFHMSPPAFAAESGGWRHATLSSTPGFREEPDMPPESDVRPSILLFYTLGPEEETQDFWHDIAAEWRSAYSLETKPDKETGQTAMRIAAGAANADEAIDRLYAFCQKEILNVLDDASGVTDADRERAPENKRPADTLKRRRGAGDDIDELFCALLTAAGVKAHLAIAPDRSEASFDPKERLPYRLTQICVAAWNGTRWRILDPAIRYAPADGLPWWEEDVSALVLDDGKVGFVHTPIADPSASTDRRTATLRLAEDGTLEGDVVCSSTGHRGANEKESNDQLSPDERERSLRESLQKRMHGAEVTQVSIELDPDAAKPYVARYHIRVPGYAQAVGRRLILEPSFFTHGHPPVFSSSERRYPVQFDYPWSEEDSVVIALPAGYAVEAQEAPKPLSIRSVAFHTTSISAAPEGGLIMYRRSFRFGENGTLSFPQSEYAAIRHAFDDFTQQDAATLTLARASENSSGGSAASGTKP
ncbi:MAG TPA: DUF3857 domain-containing protein [Candidatus Eisenbacteria bacterium]